MKSDERWTASELLLGLILTATALGCGGRARPEKPARPVRVETVEPQSPVGGLRYSATIQPYEQIPLAFKVGGYVREVRQATGPEGRTRSLQQGDAVSRGMVLARLDPADYRQRVDQARALVAEAEAGATKARADVERAESLYQGRALTRQDYDDAGAALAAARARVQGARAQLEAAETALRDSALTAPADAVILSRHVEAGMLAGVGTVGFVLADLTRVKAVFGVPDHVIQRVQPGAELRVTADAFPGVEFAGRVTAVSPSADAESRVFGVEVTIPNPERRLKAGMIAAVEVVPALAAEIPAGSPTVSVAAVVKSARSDAFAVFVADGPDEAAVVHTREVTLGAVTGNRVAVERGLAVGDRVIVSAPSLLVDGDRVRVMPGRLE